MNKPTVFLTGATGGMGMESLKAMLKDLNLYNLRVLVRDSERNCKIMEPYEGTEGLEICKGDFNDKAGLKNYLKDVSLILHIAAFVSPQADYYPEKAMQSNYGGTRNLIETIYELGQEETTKFVYIGTVAETGDRMPPIHWGRVGDPIKPSMFDYYAVSKVAAERYVIESGLKYWVSLRQTGIIGPAPVYDIFKKYNIDPIKRLLSIAKKCGVKHSAICGSCFAHFIKIRPELELTKWHPYIRSRIDQEETALSFADDNFDVAVLELPYIFGAQPGRKPVWMFIAEQIRNSKENILYPKGGSTMVTVKQVGQSVAGAIERNKGGNAYPIGYYNMTWTELLTIAAEALGYKDKKVKTIPDFLYKIGGWSLMRQQKKDNKEGGLHMVKFAALQCSNMFIDKSEGCTKLGVSEDDIKAAIGDSMKLCKDILDKKVETVTMRGE